MRELNPGIRRVGERALIEEVQLQVKVRAIGGVAWKSNTVEVSKNINTYENRTIWNQQIMGGTKAQLEISCHQIK